MGGGVRLEAAPGHHRGRGMDTALAARLTAANEADSPWPRNILEELLPGKARFVLGDTHYDAPEVRKLCESQGRILVASRHGPYPHTDAGVQVRRIFHELRSGAIENSNGQFKSIFDGQGQVCPPRGWPTTPLDSRSEPSSSSN